ADEDRSRAERKTLGHDETVVHELKRIEGVSNGERDGQAARRLQKALNTPAEDGGGEGAGKGLHQEERKKGAAAKTKPANDKSVNIGPVRRNPSAHCSEEIAAGIAEKELRIRIDDKRD